MKIGAEISQFVVINAILASRWENTLYIEFFYNPKHRHDTNESVSPTLFEETYFSEEESCLEN